MNTNLATSSKAKDTLGTEDSSSLQQLFAALATNGSKPEDPVSLDYALGTIVTAMNTIAKRKSELEVDMKDLQGRLEALRQTSMNKDEELLEAHQEMVTLKDRINEYKGEVEALKTAEAEHVEQIGSLKRVSNSIVFSGSQMNVQEIQKNKLLSESAIDDKKTVKKEDVKFDLKPEPCEWEATIWDLEERCSSLESQLADAIHDREKLDEKKQLQKQKIKEVKAARTKLRNERREALTKLEDLQKTNEATQNRLDSTVVQVKRLERELNEERTRTKSMAKGLSRRLRFYSSTTFQRYVRNLPSPLYPNSIRNIATGGQDFDLNPFAQLQARPFITLDRRLLSFEGLHALAFCTSPKHEETGGGTWYPCPTFQGIGGKEVELFLKEHGNLRYAGVFHCHLTLEWSDQGVLRPDDLHPSVVLKGSRTVHARYQPHTMKRAELLQGYRQNSYRMDCVLLECIGFNRVLYDILLPGESQNKPQLGGMKRPGEGGHSGGQKKKHCHNKPGAG